MGQNNEEYVNSRIDFTLEEAKSNLNERWKKYEFNNSIGRKCGVYD